MTSFLKLTTWKFWFYCVALVGLALTLGPADDEAYYWAIALPWKLGFGYHPPGILWSTALARAWGLGLRLPTLLFAFGSLAIAARIVAAERGVVSGFFASRFELVVALPALWASAWMTVPDWGLVFFFTLLIWSLHVGLSRKDHTSAWVALFVGAAGVMLFKLSGVLALASALLWILWCAPRPLRMRALLALTAGFFLGAIPFVYWNAQNGWSAFLYQVSERHGGGSGWGGILRWVRLWAVTILCVGPAGVLSITAVMRVAAHSAIFVRRTPVGLARFAIWAVPPLLVFGIQPLFGDFKMHWIWIAFWPAAIGGVAHLGVQLRRWESYGVGSILTVWILLSFPVLSWLRPGAPLLDVSQDLRGFEQVPAFLRAQGVWGTPVVAMRYQVTGQLAYALRGTDVPVTELPVDGHEQGDWPDLGLVDQRTGRLLRVVIAFADQRYSQRPEFIGAHCQELGVVLPRPKLLGAWGPEVPGKWIRAWRCVPELIPSGVDQKRRELRNNSSAAF